MKTITVIIFILLTTRPAILVADVFQNFDSLPVTAAEDVPGDGGGWEYSSAVTNPGYGVPTAGWWETSGYVGDSSIHDYFQVYLNTANNTHIGYSTYGYVEIDGDFSVVGNALKYTITGGYKDVSGTATEFGGEITNKETYIANPSYVDNSGGYIGFPYFYFMNNSAGTMEYFEKASGANRLSFYIWLPDGVSNGDGTDTFPLRTLGVGPYTGQDSSHWYNSSYFEGGGWTHVQVDRHPNHNNSYSSAGLYPYPSSSMREIPDFFNEMYRFYISVGGGLATNQGGIGVAPYSIWIDEIEFYNDTELQNEETINTLSIGYNGETKVWQVSFNDKYKDNANCRPVYELRYSFSPITNANWSSATPATIQEDSRFSGLSMSVTGEFQKSNAYYANVWAPFKLSLSDQGLIANGTTVYFAIKDVGQESGDGEAQRASGEGRDYANYGSTFDYTGDQTALPLIKRTFFKITDGVANGSGSKIIPGTGSKIIPGTGCTFQ